MLKVLLNPNLFSSFSEQDPTNTSIYKGIRILGGMGFMDNENIADNSKGCYDSSNSLSVKFCSNNDENQDHFTNYTTCNNASSAEKGFWNHWV